jgi:pimeloyl-ACP methyl ester carboxylesterase
MTFRSKELIQALAQLVLIATCVCSARVGAAAAASEPQRGSDGGLIVPFRINVPDAVLSDLKDRIDRTRWPDELQGAEWDYGTNQAYLKELVAYWRDRFDWRAQERRLNAFEQFTTEIDGVDVHFIHRRAKNRNGFPLLITHGWPGSVMEFTKIIESLTDPVAHGGLAEDAFDVVVPSIPGFGFSGKPKQPGYGPERMASIFAKLMARLGYSRYGAQGGDWGALISTPLAIMDAQHVVGLHLNMCIAPQPSTDPTAGLDQEEKDRMKGRLAWVTEETGYSQIQGTKPQSLGQALNDSPVGLAAWIVEKFRSWCDCGGNPETRFTKDELLTNVMIYWVTQSATSSARLYYESRHVKAAYATTRVLVPTACMVSPQEVGWSPRSWVERRFNLTRWTPMAHGGHFAALEQPDALVNDIRAFFADIRANTR